MMTLVFLPDFNPFLESILSQDVKLNYQVEVHDHIHSNIQSQEKDSLPKYQCGFQILDFSQVQMSMQKLNLGFQNNMILGLD